MSDDYIYVVGKIIGNKPGGKIIVQTPVYNVYILDRFSVVRQLDDGLCMFGIKKEEKK
ncbi:MAG: hypothetical protein U9N34_09995 [Candidatus Cloacimonadota bacterium]|nr:hypothetical protein [Candidatus Cloacimonadota bacterium]